MLGAAAVGFRSVDAAGEWSEVVWTGLPGRLAVAVDVGLGVVEVEAGGASGGPGEHLVRVAEGDCFAHAVGAFIRVGGDDLVAVQDGSDVDPGVTQQGTQPLQQEWAEAVAAGDAVPVAEGVVSDMHHQVDNRQQLVGVNRDGAAGVAPLSPGGAVDVEVVGEFIQQTGLQ